MHLQNLLTNVTLKSPRRLAWVKTFLLFMNFIPVKGPILPKLKTADNDFNLMKMTDFSKWVENTVGKGEIAHYEQFLLFPQCFQKTSTADKGLFGKGLRVQGHVTIPCV